MNHSSEEQLILHYYGEEDEAPAIERHLEECAECRALYHSLTCNLALRGIGKSQGVADARAPVEGPVDGADRNLGQFGNLVNSGTLHLFVYHV